MARIREVVSTLLEILVVLHVVADHLYRLVVFQPFLRFWHTRHDLSSELSVYFVSTLLEILATGSATSLWPLPALCFNPS